MKGVARTALWRDGSEPLPREVARRRRGPEAGPGRAPAAGDRTGHSGGEADQLRLL